MSLSSNQKKSLKGFFYGCAAGISYGTNPLGALHLYQEGLTPEVVLCHRFAWAIILLGLLIVLNKPSAGPKKSLAEKFMVHPKDLGLLAILGLLFAASALTLYASFNYMSVGLACTLLFFYPIDVAVIMGLFFKEKLTLRIMASIALSLGGVVLLYGGGEGGSALSAIGVTLVFLSSLSYAIYIVVVNKTNLSMGSVKLTFYVMLFCLLALVFYGVAFGGGFPPLPANLNQFGWGLMLGLLPSVVSLVFMAKAVKIVGSTPTAIMGALEPLTAVIIGIIAFNEVLTGRLVAGIALILTSVILIAFKKK